MCIIFPHLHFFSHENTKDKREANPEAWDLQEEDVYGEPRRAHAGVYPQYKAPAKYVHSFVDPTNSHAGHPYAYADPTIIVGKAQFSPQAYPYNYEPARYVQLFSWTIAAS